MAAAWLLRVAFAGARHYLRLRQAPGWIAARQRRQRRLRPRLGRLKLGHQPRQLLLLRQHHLPRPHGRGRIQRAMHAASIGYGSIGLG